MTMTSGSISAIRAGDAGHVVDDGDVLMPGLAQSGLDDRGADAVFVDDENAEGTGSHMTILPPGRLWNR